VWGKFDSRRLQISEIIDSCLASFTSSTNCHGITARISLMALR
jgi:hypothetical protein